MEFVVSSRQHRAIGKQWPQDGVKSFTTLLGGLRVQLVDEAWIRYVDEIWLDADHGAILTMELFENEDKLSSTEQVMIPCVPMCESYTQLLGMVPSEGD